MELKEKLKEYQRSSIVLDIVEPAKYERGGSRFGGHPDVPPDFVWPVYKGQPLAFLAQFDCAALACHDFEHLLPDHGVLSFFYELESQRWGYDPADKGCCRAYWFEDVSVLAPAEFPSGLARAYRVPILNIECLQKKSLPGEADYFELCLNADSGENFNAVWETMEVEVEEHKLLGWPDVIQGSMPVECDLASQGYWMGGGGGPGIPIPEETLERAQKSAKDRWMLLFQLGYVSSGDFKLMFGDMGRIYFYIQKEDLAARRFDRVWLILQCC